MSNPVNFEGMSLNNLPIGGHFQLSRDGEYLDRENEVWRNSGYLKRTDSKVNVLLIGPACKDNLRQRILRAAEDKKFATGFPVNVTGTIKLDGVPIHYIAIQPGIKLAREILSWSPQQKKKSMSTTLAFLVIGCLVLSLVSSIIIRKFFFQPEQIGVVYFSDNYDNSDETRKLWRQESGKWQVIDEKYTCGTNESRCLSLTEPAITKNFTVVVDVFGKEGVEKSVYFGITSQNSYRVSLRSDPINQVILTKTTKGQSDIVLAQAEFNNSSQTWYHMVIKVEKGLVEVYVDNNLVLYFEDASVENVQGLVGLGVESIRNNGADKNSAEFDNFQVLIDE
ncbi:MAG TPA: hypothetical protein PLA27_07290 [Anaerolineales bacterium]|jgi:hypothetical protein|nr:hypothetical protein [Anaerolineales bacterium]